MKKMLSMSTVPMQKIIRRGSSALLLMVTLLLILPIFLIMRAAPHASGNVIDSTDSPDKLTYVSASGLMLYDPLNRTETLLLEGVLDFAMSQDGSKVAYTSRDREDPAFYIVDLETPDAEPIPIRLGPDRSYPLAWSFDGRSLAFVSYHGIYDGFLYVWDGEQVTNIMPDNGLSTAVGFYADWSHDGRLAFQLRYASRNNDIPPEIYLWDGETTINLSQNPEGWDGNQSFSGFNDNFRWSNNGKLMFWSQRDNGIYLYVWDGTSFEDNMPKIDKVTPDVPNYYPPLATWVAGDIIGYMVDPKSSPSGKRQIILWDVNEQAVIEQYEVVSDYSWSRMAEGGDVILSLAPLPHTHSYLDIEDTQGNILFRTSVQFVAWSADGYLAYCWWNYDIGWTLSVWDGQETWDVTRSFGRVSWQNEQYSFGCTNG